MADYGELEYHGLVPFVYDETETGIAGVDYGEFEYHGLVLLAYAVAAAINTNLLATSIPYAGSETNLTTIAIPG